eukprot:jgi/Mesvir1/21607/Mv04034-RA.1
MAESAALVPFGLIPSTLCVSERQRRLYNLQAALPVFFTGVNQSEIISLTRGQRDVLLYCFPQSIVNNVAATKEAFRCSRTELLLASREAAEIFSTLAQCLIKLVSKTTPGLRHQGDRQVDSLTKRHRLYEGITSVKSLRADFSGLQYELATYLKETCQMLECLWHTCEVAFGSAASAAAPLQSKRCLQTNDNSFGPSCQRTAGEAGASAQGALPRPHRVKRPSLQDISNLQNFQHASSGHPRRTHSKGATSVGSSQMGAEASKAVLLQRPMPGEIPAGVQEELRAARQFSTWAHEEMERLREQRELGMAQESAASTLVDLTQIVPGQPDVNLGDCSTWLQHEQPCSADCSCISWPLDEMKCELARLMAGADAFLCTRNQRNALQIASESAHNALRNVYHAQIHEMRDVLRRVVQASCED